MIHTNDLYIKCFYCQNDDIEKLYIQKSCIMQDGFIEHSLYGKGIGVQLTFKCEECNKLTEIKFLTQEITGRGDEKKYPINMAGDGELSVKVNNN